MQWEALRGGFFPKGELSSFPQFRDHKAQPAAFHAHPQVSARRGCSLPQDRGAAFPAWQLWVSTGHTNSEFLTSRPVHHVILGDERRDLAVVSPLVARLLLGGFLLALLGGLLGGGTVVVIVLVLAVLTLSVVLGASLQGAAAPGPRVLALPALVPLVPLLVPVPVPVLLFVFVFLLVCCHDSPRAFFCPLTAGPP